MNEPLKSPLKDKPLRHAGQSLEEERRALWDDKIEPWCLMAVFMMVMAALEWFRYLTNSRWAPGMFTVAALITIGLAVRKVLTLRPHLRNLRQGIEGEKAVGQYLERLRAQGYEVLHDIVAPGFNVDHVLIGPSGVLTIETKTWSKPNRGEARISFDGEQLLAAGMAPDRNPVIQARAQAAWLKAMLLESTGKKFEVRPVVLFPGWFIEQSHDSRRSMWVLEPKALPAFLEREPKLLEVGDSKLAAFHLSRFVRSVERERAAAGLASWTRHSTSVRRSGIELGAD